MQDQQHPAGFSQQQQQLTPRHTQSQKCVPLSVKLSMQAERIMNWKTQNDLEISTRDEKIQGLQSVIQRQYSNLMGQQMECEKLSQRLQSELMQRGELKGHIDNTRHMCSVLQKHCNQLSETLKRCVDDKVVLTQVFTENMKEIEKLKKCYSSRETKLNVDMENLQELLEAERAGRALSDAESSVKRASLENTLKEYTEALQVAETKAEALDKDLSITKENLKKIVEQRDKALAYLEQMKQQLVQVETALTNENSKLQQNLAQAATFLESEKQRVTLISSENETLKGQLSEALQVITKGNEDLGAKQQVVEALTSDLQQKEQELQHQHEMVESLEGDKLKLEDQVSEMVQLRSELSSVSQSLETAIEEKQQESLRLAQTMAKVDDLTKELQDKEELLKKTEEDYQSCNSKITTLEQANLKLNEDLSSAEEIVSTLTEDFKQLKLDWETECEKCETLEKNLISLSSSHKTQLEEKLAELEQQKQANEQLSTQYENKCSLLEQEIKTLQGSLTGEGDRSVTLIAELSELKKQTVQTKTNLEGLTNELNETSRLLKLANEEKFDLQTRMESLHQQITTVNLEKNEALLQAACTLKDKQTLQTELDTKLQEKENVIGQLNREYDEMVLQKTEDEEKLVDRIQVLKEEKEKCEERLDKVKADKKADQEKIASVENQLDDVLAKCKDLADGEAKRKRLAEKVRQLEKLIRVRDQELKDLRGAAKITPSPKVQTGIRDQELKNLRGAAKVTPSPKVQTGIRDQELKNLQGAAKVTPSPKVQTGIRDQELKNLQGSAKVTPSPKVQTGIRDQELKNLQGASKVTPSPKVQTGIRDQELKDLRGGAKVTPSPKVQTGIRDQALKNLRGAAKVTWSPAQTSSRPNTKTNSGISNTPKTVPTLPLPTRSILKPPSTPKTPPTPNQAHKRRVSFENVEDSSDTDGSVLSVFYVDEKEVERRVAAFNRGDINTTPMKVSRSPLTTLSRPNVVATTSGKVAATTSLVETPPKKARFSSSGDSPLVPPKTPKRKSVSDAVANSFDFDDDD